MLDNFSSACSARELFFKKKTPRQLCLLITKKPPTSFKSFIEQITYLNILKYLKDEENEVNNDNCPQIENTQNHLPNITKQTFVTTRFQEYIHKINK